MGPLAQVFSTAEGVRRKLIDALRNPSDAVAQYAGNEMDRLRGFADLNNRAQDEFMTSGSMRGPVQNELMQVVAESYSPVGMVKGGPIASRLNEKYGNALDAYLMEGDRINLSKVVVPKEMRGQGVGSAFMRDLVGMADEQGKTVTLTPSSDFGGNKARLEQFYKQFGFVPNKGKFKDYEISESMYRLPE